VRVGLERASNSVSDDDPLRGLFGQPGHPVDDTADEGDPTVGAMHLKRDRPSRGQAVRTEVGVGARHRVDATTFVVEHKTS
jgi:hypothetical protein